MLLYRNLFDFSFFAVTPFIFIRLFTGFIFISGDSTFDGRFVDPSLRELPHLDCFVFSAGDEQLFIFNPLHLCDHISMRLQHINRLLGLQIPHRDHSCVIACYNFTSGFVSHADHSDSLLTIDLSDCLGELLLTRSAHIVQSNTPINLTYTE